MSKGCVVTKPDFLGAAYRDDLGAALARLDVLEPKVKSLATLPSKKDLFQRIRESFIFHPERWKRKRIGWFYRDPYGGSGWTDRDGWVIDSLKQDERSIGFYRIGFFWIRIGEVRKQSGKLEKVNVNIWVYIFCPRFRCTIRKYKTWHLLKNLEMQDE